MKLQTIKAVLIIAEIAALILTGALLYISANKCYFDFCTAGIVGILVICTIIFQAIQQEITWKE